MNTASLDALVNVFKKTTDPRSKQGVTHPYHGMVALVLQRGSELIRQSLQLALQGEA